jgi:hypothetical protein
MVGENFRQHGFVFGLHQIIDGARGQLVEGLIRWREHGERPWAFESLHESSGFHGGYEGGVVGGIDCVLDDIFCGKHFLSAHDGDFGFAR